MANQLFTPQAAATSALAALRYLSVLPRTVRQDYSSEFVAGRGRSIDIPAPITLTGDGARVYTQDDRAARNAIVFDELAQSFVSIKMDTQVYKAVREPDDFATFDLTSLEQQIIAPMSQTVVEGVTKPLIDLIAATPDDKSVPALAGDGANLLTVLVKLRQVLNTRNVPLGARTIAIGPGVEAAILQNELLQKVNESGSDGVLREATIGRLMGFDLVVDQHLPENMGVAYDADAFALVTRPSLPPRGAAYTATASQDGFALRWLQHYNPLQLEDQIVIDTFVGAGVLDAQRAVSFKLA